MPGEHLSKQQDITPLDIVRERVRSREGLEPFQRKVYELRRLVAGDLSVVHGQHSAQSEDQQLATNQEFYDFIITQFTTGKSNKLLQTVKTLLMQTTYYFPEVVFENLAAHTAALNAQYCAQRLGDAPLGCNARDHMRMAALDYMIAGIGWVKTCVHGEKPAIQVCDVLDMAWDRSVRLACDIRWASCRYREPLANWIQMFGREPFARYLVGDDPLGPEQIVELEYYYDIQGPQGSMYVFDVRDPHEPILAQANPYYYEEAGVRRPFLPYEPFYLLQLPSLRQAIGLVEQMLPNQLAVWDAENNMAITLERNAPFYTVSAGALDAEQRKLLEAGDVGAIIELQGQGAITPQQGIKIDPQVMHWRDQNNLEIIAQGGANPYAAGAPVAGVSYAAEVNAIQGQSGLMASNIAKDLAAFWTRVIRKFLGVAKLYDDQPCTLLVDGVELRFDPYQPISRFLRPQAHIVVKESTMQFKPQEQKIQEATLKLQVAVSVAQQFPNALAKAFEDYLLAMGEKDVEGWMEAPPAMPQAPAMGQVQSGAEDIPSGLPLAA